ncbi:MAG: AAA family ATPase [Stellaceae bacterium]
MALLPAVVTNPFRPGAGQKPIYLAGRDEEQKQFLRMLEQNPVSQNLILTGLRGSGKTVLLDELKPLAQKQGWLWAGNDMSESTSLTEERLARRIIVDLSTLLAPMVIQRQKGKIIGFAHQRDEESRPIEFSDLWKVYEKNPGLTSDKLLGVLRQVANLLAVTKVQGVVLAYDEAQNMSDHAGSSEYPLSLLLDVFSNLQRSELRFRFLLILSGLPTIFPKLNEARTYTERMFHVMQLERLTDKDAREAIEKPIELTKSPLKFAGGTIKKIVEMSAGYPYFIQFVCKEVFDAWIGKISSGEAASVPMTQIEEKLDQDFFSPRWARATDRQQDFMKVIATLESGDDEFTVQEIVEASRKLLKKGFSASHAAQILLALNEKGLVYRNRRGGYRFAVPLLTRFINRQSWDMSSLRGKAL